MYSAHGLFNGKRLLSAPSCVFLISALTAWLAQAQSNPPPRLAVTRWLDGAIQLTVTNGSAGGRYDLYYRPTETQPGSASPSASGFQAVPPWDLYQSGQSGQTSFLVRPLLPWSFFQAHVSGDWDNDGVPDPADARPADPTIGHLNVIIETPLNGAVIH